MADIAAIAAMLKIYINRFLLKYKADWLETILVTRWAIQGHIGPHFFNDVMLFNDVISEQWRNSIAWKQSVSIYNYTGKNIEK